MSNVSNRKNQKNLKRKLLTPIALPILAKIIEKQLFDDYLIGNRFLTTCQSRFIKSGSGVNQLLCITHEIHKNLYANPSIDTIGIFLDISKAFVKVWYNGLICK